MLVEIKEYTSANDIVKMLDHEITRTRNTLSGSLRRLDDIRTLAERSKKVRAVVSKLAGKKAVENASGDIVLGDLNLVVDASHLQELAALEEAVRSQQNQLMMLQKAREDMRWIDQIEDAEGVNYLVLERSGMPTRILVKIS
jgi:hypothetical protein